MTDKTQPPMKSYDEMSQVERDAFELQHLGRRPSLAEIARRERERERGRGE